MLNKTMNTLCRVTGCAALAFACFVCSPANSAEKSTNAAASSTAPTVQREQLLLQKLAGAWDVTINAKMPDGSALTTTGTAIGQAVAGGLGVSMRLTFEIPGVGLNDETDLAGFDAATQKIHMYTVSSQGIVHDHWGELSDDNTFKLHWEGISEGGKATEEITFKFTGNSELRVHEDDTLNGKPAGSYDFVCRKSAHS